MAEIPAISCLVDPERARADLPASVSQSGGGSFGAEVQAVGHAFVATIYAGITYAVDGAANIVIALAAWALSAWLDPRA